MSTDHSEQIAWQLKDISTALASISTGIQLMTATLGDIAAALEAAQPTGGWEYTTHNDDRELYESWERRHPEWQYEGDDVNSVTGYVLRIYRRPRQQPAPAQDAAEDGDDMVYDIGNCSALRLDLAIEEGWELTGKSRWDAEMAKWYYEIRRPHQQLTAT